MATYGECPVCRQGWAVKKDGTMRRHDPGDGIDCPGVGRPPLVSAPTPRALLTAMGAFVGPRPRWHVIAAERDAAARAK